MSDFYWITESRTWRIYAETETEAREIWAKYWENGVSWTELPMDVKDGSVEANWDWHSCTHDGAPVECTCDECAACPPESRGEMCSVCGEEIMQ